jgi:hypothetical protein
VKTSDITITRGSYRGIGFEINHPTENYKFTYYISLNLRNIKDIELADSLWLEAVPTGYGNSKTYNYYDVPLFGKIHFHGGITWYSKSFNSNDNKLVKIGCDYNHSWDEYKYYDIEMVLEDVKQTIDDIHKEIVYLMFCHGDGSLIPEPLGKYSKHGDFWSNAYIQNKGMEDQFKDIGTTESA